MDTHLGGRRVGRERPVVTVDPQRGGVEGLGDRDGRRWAEPHLGARIGAAIGQLADVATPYLLLARALEGGLAVLGLDGPALKVLEVDEGRVFVLGTVRPLHLVRTLTYDLLAASHGTPHRSDE